MEAMPKRMNDQLIAIIGGTGVYQMPGVVSDAKDSIDTPYGEIEFSRARFIVNDRGASLPLIFLPRHGYHHSIPPHRINFRANLYGLKQLGVTHILATAAVGSLRKEIAPAELVLLDQFIDFTRCRCSTFFDGGDMGVEHTDMTDPYDSNLRQSLLEAAKRADLFLRDGGTYACTEGPRFESRAEVKMLAQLGGDVVGMTNVPEVVLARELGIPYAVVALVTNYGAGLSDQPLTHAEVTQAMDWNKERLQQLLQAWFYVLMNDH